MPHDLSQPAQTAQPLRSEADRPSRPAIRRKRKRPITIGVSSGEETHGLRLVGASAPDMKPPTQNPTPIHGAADPRWVLAVRAAEMLEGNVLPPAKRESLMRTGKVMGLSPFDCSLILAIVQDRARRGVAPEHCPAAGETQLALIPLPPTKPVWSAFTDKPLQVGLLAAGMLAFQALLMWIWLG